MNQEKLNLIKSSLPLMGQAATPSAKRIISMKDLDELQSDRITPEMELPPMQPLFSIHGVPCFYRGELTADCGKAKSGKTTFLSILMAATIKRQTLALERLTDEPLKVLWIDTEQSQQSTQEILKERIMPLAGVDKLDDTQFFAFNLRGVGFEKRGRMVDVAIRSIKPDICIIDGVKDLMTDINDAVQATLIMEKLMELAKEMNCCIVCVLHQNKSEQDRNMRGSIGTELTNKAFEVFQCSILGDDETFKVEQTYSRKRKIKQNFYYTINKNGLPEACANYHEQPRDAQGRFMSMKQDMSADEVDKLLKVFVDAFEGRSQRRFNELMAVALKKCGVADAATYYAYLAKAEDAGVVRKMEHPETGETWVELLDNTLPF